MQNENQNIQVPDTPIDREYALKINEKKRRGVTHPVVFHVSKVIEELIQKFPAPDDQDAKASFSIKVLSELAVQDVTKPIDRAFAIEQVEKEIQVAAATEWRFLFEEIKNLLIALPSPADLDEHVCCAECAHFSCSEDDLSCPHADDCHFWDTEDSMPRRVRWLYARREGQS